MKNDSSSLLIALMLAVIVISCNRNSSNGPKNVTNDDGKIYITDRTGKEWEISHAVNNYGMKPENFRYGLGPNAIRPINTPEMLSEGDVGYPSPSSQDYIIGINLNNDVRAYSISALSRHEVVNDKVGGIDVAVVY